MESINIIYAEDEKLLRETMIHWLANKGINIIGEASNGFELLELLENKTPDIILLDLQMPGMDGNKVLSIVQNKFPQIKIIVLSSFDHSDIILDFKSKGVNAYLTKETDLNVILEIIKKVFYSSEYRFFPSKIKSILTKREIQITPLICSGKTSHQIAEILNISERTVEAHRNRLYIKTKSKNLSDFVSYCTKEGLEYLGKGTLINPPK